MAELIKVLDECDDSKSVIKAVLEQHPYAKKLHAGKFEPSHYTLDKLYQALETASYLAIDAKFILNEILKRIGQDLELFMKTYRPAITDDMAHKLSRLLDLIDDDDDNGPFKITPKHSQLNISDYTRHLSYEPVSGINKFFAAELKLHYGPPPYMRATLYFIMCHPCEASFADNIYLTKLFESCDISSLHVLKTAFMGDAVNCAEYLFENGHDPVDLSEIDVIADNDSINCLKLVRSYNIKITQSFINRIITSDSVQCLAHLYEQKLIPEPAPLIKSARIKCLKFLCEVAGVPITADQVTKFLAVNKFDEFHYSLSRCQPTESILRKAALNRDERYFISALCYFSILPDAFSISHIFKSPQHIEALINAGYILSLNDMEMLVDNIECFKCAHKLGGPLNSTLYTAAATTNELQTVQYLHENKCPWDDNFPLRAVRFDSFECLYYALANGCDHNLANLRHSASTKKGSRCHQYLFLISRLQ